MIVSRKPVLAASLLLAAGLMSPTAGALEWQYASSGVRYVTGGVGVEERAAIQTDFSEAVLRVVNVEHVSGAYLAGVQIGVSDNEFELLNAESDGPWFLIDMPPGTYRISSELNGAVQSRSVTVQQRPLKEVVFRWEKLAPDPVPPLVPLHSAPPPDAGRAGLESGLPASKVEDVEDSVPVYREQPEAFTGHESGSSPITIPGAACPEGAEFEPGCI